MAEGAQAVREALARPRTVVELFVEVGAADGAGFIATAQAAGIPVDLVSAAASRSLSETVNPQGIVAVCRTVDRPLTDLFEGPSANRSNGSLRLVVGLIEANDPGNAGTILRVSDAAGADAVVLSRASVDIYNGKAVRASAGSLFHVDVVTETDPVELIVSARAAGLQVLATSGTGESGLDLLADAGQLAEPTLWLFGNEARGLPDAVMAAADHLVRVPIYGQAESLNLAAAATVCLYASARAQRRRPRG
ncbi:MAG: tRNA/rRNA methyltransferase [Pseudonocardiales bacterium]|nr:tRNA/rRNA methyltransferase [Pseudonocardiales bacterium]